MNTFTSYIIIISIITDHRKTREIELHLQFGSKYSFVESNYWPKSLGILVLIHAVATTCRLRCRTFLPTSALPVLCIIRKCRTGTFVTVTEYAGSELST